MNIFGVPVKAGDFLVLFISLLVTAGGFYIALDREEPALVRIDWDGKTSLYPLDEERIIPLEGSLGYNEIHITGTGMVEITDADCPDRLCMNMGAIEKSGQYIACMPHRLFITITGREDETVDTAVW